MSDCRNLEPMLAPYVDGEAEPHTRAAVDEHLRKCPPCAERVATEKAARDVLRTRRDELRGSATEHLRRRCAAQRGVAQSSPPAARAAAGLARRSMGPLAVAASLIVLVGTILFLGLNRGVELLAAQLAVDHVKCHQFLSEPKLPPDPVVLSKEWQRERGWPLPVPASTPELDLRLLEVRRCGSSEGPNAHIMYSWHGKPLSVYVMDTESKRATEAEQFVTKVGQDAIIWNEHGRTYAVVGHGNQRELDRVVNYVKLSVRSR